MGHDGTLTSISNRLSIYGEDLARHCGYMPWLIGMNQMKGKDRERGEAFSHGES